MLNNLLKNNINGFALLGAIIAIVIVTMTSLGILINSSGEAKLAQESSDSTQAFYAAETALAGIAFQLRTCDNWDDNIWSDVTTLNTPFGSAQLDNIIFSNAAQTVDVTLTATYKNEQRQIQTTISYSGCNDTANIPGAVSLRASLPKANGSLLIDGRNHDRDCNLINDGSGTYALVMEEEEGDFDFSGSATLGASSGGSDFDPMHTTTDRVLFEASDLPDSPDDVFGLDEGSLKQKAQTNGAYHYNPGNDAYTVVSGVNYIEMPCDTGSGENEWAPNGINMDDTADDSILVIHSACNDALYDANKGGLFRGIMITDYIDTLHGEIRGALITTGSGSLGGNIGNGGGVICYSSQVLQDAITQGGVDAAILTMSAWQENSI